MWFLPIVAAQAPKYGPCQTNDLQAILSKGNLTIPITQVVNTPGLQISGSIQIVDGCTVFKINLVCSKRFYLYQC